MKIKCKNKYNLNNLCVYQIISIFLISNSILITKIHFYNLNEYIDFIVSHKEVYLHFYTYR